MRTLSSPNKSLAPLLAACAMFSGASAWSQANVIVDSYAGDTFVTLPRDANSPEGIAVDPATGDFFVGTLDIKPDGTGTNFLLRYNRQRQVVATLPLGPIPVTGLAFNARDRKVYFAKAAGLLGLNSFISRVPSAFTNRTPVEDVATIPNIGAPADRTETTLDGRPISISFGDSVPAPNGLAFRLDGSLYVTDSLQAAVFKINDPTVAANTCPTSTDCVQTFKQDPLLASAGVPALGANGIVFSPDGSTLFVTNTGDDRLLAMQMSDQKLVVLTNGLDGADGVQIGPSNTLVVARAMADDFAIVDPGTGRVLAELGNFRGLTRDGSVKGFLFAGSFVIANNVLYATNLALPTAGLPSEPEVDVKTYTISRMPLPLVVPR